MLVSDNSHAEHSHFFIGKERILWNMNVSNGHVHVHVEVMFHFDTLSLNDTSVLWDSLAYVQ